MGARMGACIFRARLRQRTRHSFLPIRTQHSAACGPPLANEHAQVMWAAHAAVGDVFDADEHVCLPWPQRRRAMRFHTVRWCRAAAAASPTRPPRAEPCTAPCESLTRASGATALQASGALQLHAPQLQVDRATPGNVCTFQAKRASCVRDFCFQRPMQRPPTGGTGRHGVTSTWRTSRSRPNFVYMAAIASARRQESPRTRQLRLGARSPVGAAPWHLDRGVVSSVRTARPGAPERPEHQSGLHFSCSPHTAWRTRLI